MSLSLYTREADRKRERAEVAAATQHTIYTYVRYIFLAAHYTRTADNTHYIYMCVYYTLAGARYIHRRGTLVTHGSYAIVYIYMCMRAVYERRDAHSGCSTSPALALASNNIYNDKATATAADNETNKQQ